MNLPPSYPASKELTQAFDLDLLVDQEALMEVFLVTGGEGPYDLLAKTPQPLGVSLLNIATSSSPPPPLQFNETQKAFVQEVVRQAVGEVQVLCSEQVCTVRDENRQPISEGFSWSDLRRAQDAFGDAHPAILRIFFTDPSKLTSREFEILQEIARALGGSLQKNPMEEGPILQALVGGASLPVVLGDTVQRQNQVYVITKRGRARRMSVAERSKAQGDEAAADRKRGGKLSKSKRLSLDEQDVLTPFHSPSIRRLPRTGGDHKPRIRSRWFVPGTGAEWLVTSGKYITKPGRSRSLGNIPASEVRKLARESPDKFLLQGYYRSSEDNPYIFGNFTLQDIIVPDVNNPQFSGVADPKWKNQRLSQAQYYSDQNQLISQSGGRIDAVDVDVYRGVFDTQDSRIEPRWLPKRSLPRLPKIGQSGDRKEAEALEALRRMGSKPDGPDINGRPVNREFLQLFKADAYDVAGRVYEDLRRGVRRAPYERVLTLGATYDKLKQLNSQGRLSEQGSALLDKNPVWLIFSTDAGAEGPLWLVQQGSVVFPQSKRPISSFKSRTRRQLLQLQPDQIQFYGVYKPPRGSGEASKRVRFSLSEIAKKEEELGTTIKVRSAAPLYPQGFPPNRLDEFLKGRGGGLNFLTANFAKVRDEAERYRAYLDPALELVELDTLMASYDTRVDLPRALRPIQRLVDRGALRFRLDQANTPEGVKHLYEVAKNEGKLKLDVRSRYFALNKLRDLAEGPVTRRIFLDPTIPHVFKDPNDPTSGFTESFQKIRRDLDRAVKGKKGSDVLPSDYWRAFPGVSPMAGYGSVSLESVPSSFPAPPSSLIDDDS